MSEKDRERLHFMNPEEFFTFLEAPLEPAHEEATVGGTVQGESQVPAGDGRVGNE